MHDPSFTMVRACFDQAVRAGALTDKEAADNRTFVDRAETLSVRRGESARATLLAKARQLKDSDQRALADEMRRLAESRR